MRFLLSRRPSVAAEWRPERKTTYGTLYVDHAMECFTLEDEIREIPGEPVEQWKVHAQTAIPAGVYDIELQDSPKFGHDTMTLLNVPGFKYVRIHSVTDIDDTEGCIGVGDTVDEGHFEIRGGKAHEVLAKLKAKVQDAIRGRHEKVTIEIRNPE